MAALLLLVWGLVPPTVTPPAKSPFERELEATAAEEERLAGRPEAIAPLYRLHDLEEVVSVGTWQKALSEAAHKLKNPLVLAHAQAMLLAVDERKGDEAAAAERRRGLALVERWL